MALKPCDDRQRAPDPGDDLGRLTGDLGLRSNHPLHEWVIDRGSGRFCCTENGYLDVVKAVAFEVGLEEREDLIGTLVGDESEIEPGAGNCR